MQTARLPFRFGEAFFIVGPTGCGKSDIAAEVAVRIGAEVIGVDAFQIYRNLPRLTAHPSAATLQRVPHHLIGVISPQEEMSAARYAELACEAMRDVRSRGRSAVVAGGSGLYVRALTDGFVPAPPPNPALRERLNQLSLGELTIWLRRLDAGATRRLDMQNKRRVQRALEICLLNNNHSHAAIPSAPSTEGAASTLRTTHATAARGVFLFRDRDDLYQRIDLRVERMFADGVVEEVRMLGEIGATARQAIGWREIRALLAGTTAMPECIAAIQQATRRYAKRQLTWFHHQTSFEPLNLSHCSTAEAIERIVAKARLSFAR